MRVMSLPLHLASFTNGKRKHGEDGDEEDMDDDDETQEGTQIFSSHPLCGSLM
jgi:hypothetical protein